MFQRRHYQKIAETLAEMGSITMKHIKLDVPIIERFIIMFRRDNERFDADRFIKAFNEHYEFIWGVHYPYNIRSYNNSPNAA